MDQSKTYHLTATYILLAPYRCIRTSQKYQWNKWLGFLGLLHCDMPLCRFIYSAMILEDQDH